MTKDNRDDDCGRGGGDHDDDDDIVYHIFDFSRRLLQPNQRHLWSRL